MVICINQDLVSDTWILHLVRRMYLMSSTEISDDTHMLEFASKTGTAPQRWESTLLLKQEFLKLQGLKTT
jgi:hypothetical protein